MSSRLTPRNTLAIRTTPWQQEAHRQAGGARMGPSTADPQDMLQLMRSTRGRMQGNVSFRMVDDPADSWVNVYCFVDTDSASLLYEVPVQTVESSFETLISNLRGLQVSAAFDEVTRSNVIEIVSFETGHREVLQLRPERQTYFNSWFAAFLCWSSCAPEQVYHESKVNQFSSPPIIGDEKPRALLKGERTNAPLLIERALLLREGSPGFSDPDAPSNTTATEVSCVIRGTGEFSVYTPRAHERRALVTVQLRAIPRSAIQRLHKSVFGLSRTLVIYPQYSQSQTACSIIRPLYLSFNYTDSFEKFFVLLRTLTLPEFYRVRDPFSIADPHSDRTSFRSTSSNEPSRIFRIEHSLNAKVQRVTILNDTLQPSPHEGAIQHGFNDYYIEILVDEQVKAKTSIRTPFKGGVFWSESFDLTDLPSVLSSLSFRLKKRYNQGSAMDMSETASIMTSKTGMYVRSVHSSLDAVAGVAEVSIGKIETSKDKKLNCELTDDSGSVIAEMTVELHREEHCVLMEEDYELLTGILQDFTNGLTLDIFSRTSQPAETSVTLLNVFQACGIEEPWLRHLVQDEICNPQRQHKDRLLKLGTASATNVSTPGANQQLTSPNLRDEAFLLFRSNTLLTRTLDSYMRRVGQAYLETTLRVKLQDIVDEEKDCEIDPSKLANKRNEKVNRDRLMGYALGVWSFIRHSAFQCPKQLRRIFRTIRDTAVSRFDEVMPSKRYTSVSSFLFLRFFCAAISDPKHFGLVKVEPGPYAKRTFKLLAKTLQGLANMTTFGNKEPWMAPMNSFCTSNQRQFESFIESICDVDIETPPEPQMPGSESTSTTEAETTGPHSPSSTYSATSTSQSRGSGKKINESTGRRPDSVITVIEPQSSTGAGESDVASAVSSPVDSPISPSDFDIDESAAYRDSFAVDEWSLKTDSLDDDTEWIGSRRRSLDLATEEIANRASTASGDTIIHIGPLRDSKQESNFKGSWLRIDEDEDVDDKDEDLDKSTWASSRSLPRAEGTIISDDGFGITNANHKQPASEPLTRLSQLRHGYRDIRVSQERQEAVQASRSQDGILSEVGLPPRQIEQSKTHRSTPPSQGSLRSSSSTRTLRSRPSLELSINDPLRLVLERLPATAREGLLSLPGLIDPAKNLAFLVDSWLGSIEIRMHRAAESEAAMNGGNNESTTAIMQELNNQESCLGKFHHLCLEADEKVSSYLKKAIAECAENAEQNEDETGITARSIAVKWVTIAERMEAAPEEFWAWRAAARPGSNDSSVYTRTVNSDEYASSRGSLGTMSPMSPYSPAIPPPNIAREREKPTRAKSGGLSLFSSAGFNSGIPSTRGQPSLKDKKSSKPPSVSSGGSVETGRASKLSGSRASTKSRKKSPSRTAEDNAMRKLGWM